MELEAEGGKERASGKGVRESDIWSGRESLCQRRTRLNAPSKRLSKWQLAITNFSSKAHESATEFSCKNRKSNCCPKRKKKQQRRAADKVAVRSLESGVRRAACPKCRVYV